MKEFVHKRKLQLSGAKNREVIPELRSIPLTRYDCEQRVGKYHPFFCLLNSNRYKRMLCLCNKCPRGFP
jgi:hypothetical protein